MWTAAAKTNDLGIIAQNLLPAKDCKNSSAWADKAVAAAAKAGEAPKENLVSCSSCSAPPMPSDNAAMDPCW
jgi:hypothetical protein